MLSICRTQSSWVIHIGKVSLTIRIMISRGDYGYTVESSLGVFVYPKMDLAMQSSLIGSLVLRLLGYTKTGHSMHHSRPMSMDT